MIVCLIFFLCVCCGVCNRFECAKSPLYLDKEMVLYTFVCVRVSVFVMGRHF